MVKTCVIPPLRLLFLFSITDLNLFFGFFCQNYPPSHTSKRTGRQCHPKFDAFADCRSDPSHPSYTSIVFSTLPLLPPSSYAAALSSFFKSRVNSLETFPIVWTFVMIGREVIRLRVIHWEKSAHYRPFHISIDHFKMLSSQFSDVLIFTTRLSFASHYLFSSFLLIRKSSWLWWPFHQRKMFAICFSFRALVQCKSGNRFRKKVGKRKNDLLSLKNNEKVAN